MDCASKCASSMASQPRIKLIFLYLHSRIAPRFVKLLNAKQVTKYQPTAPSEETCTMIYFKITSKVMKVNVTSQFSDANARALAAQLQFVHFLSLLNNKKNIQEYKMLKC